MSGRGQNGPGAKRTVRQRAAAAVLLILGLLLFTWPFVRTPPLPLGSSFLHVLGAWSIVVLALFAISRSLVEDRGADDA